MLIGFCIDNGVDPRGCGGGGGGPGTASNAGASGGIEVVEVKDSGGVPISGVPFSNNNGVYFPMIDTDTAECQFSVYGDSTVTIGIVYAMSAANANTVAMDLEIAALEVGTPATSAYGAATSATLSPGADTNVHFVQPAGWTVAPGEQGDTYRARITRKTDSHPGELRLIGITTTLEAP